MSVNMHLDFAAHIDAGLLTVQQVDPAEIAPGELASRVVECVEKQGVTMISFGLEQRAGGHLFQLNFSNGFGTTLAQVARGGSRRDDWYLGFNLSRKFY